MREKEKRGSGWREGDGERGGMRKGNEEGNEMEMGVGRAGTRMWMGREWGGREGGQYYAFFLPFSCTLFSFLLSLLPLLYFHLIIYG